VDGLYFSVVTMLTIGFGDFLPTTTATKVILFPFTILVIAQLANQVGMIIEFVLILSLFHRLMMLVQIFFATLGTS